MSYIQLSAIFWIVLFAVAVIIGIATGHTPLTFGVSMGMFLVIGLWDYCKKSK